MQLSEAISYLHNIYIKRELVPFDDIPTVLKKDFWKFMYGATVSKNSNGDICANSEDFNAWYNKLIIHGIDILDDEYRTADFTV
ncbi:MAG: hypothetical protein COA97_07200 [Flavobacteriales bacterium]|nr:MAG: hypothetical protein COA97_07200 [Flavobacteriales bacterium]